MLHTFYCFSKQVRIFHRKYLKYGRFIFRIHLLRISESDTETDAVQTH